MATLSALGLQLFDLVGLVLGPDSGEVSVDPQVGSDGGGHGLGVTGDHDYLYATGVQRFYGVPGLAPDFVGEPQRADHLSVEQDVQDDRSLGPPLLRDIEFGGAFLVQQVGPTNLNMAPVDCG